MGVSFAPDGSLYVADKDTYTVKRVIGDRIEIVRQFERTSAGFNSGIEPCSVHVKTAEEIYVSTCNARTVIKMDSRGTVLRTYPGNIAGLRQGVNWHPGMTIDSLGNIYLSDESSHVIIKIVESTGVAEIYSGRIGQIGSANGDRRSATHSYPRGLAVDSKNNLYVADGGSSLIRVISPAGQVSSLTTSAISNGSRCNVVGVATNSKDEVFYVLERACNAIGKIGGSILVEGGATAPNVPTSIYGKPLFAGNSAFAINKWGSSPTNQFALGDFANSNVKIFDSSGRIIRTIGSPNGWGTATPNNLEAVYNHPSNVFALSDGTVIVQDNSTLKHVGTNGEILHNTFLSMTCWYSRGAFADNGIFFCRDWQSIVARFPDGSLVRIGAIESGYRDGRANTARFSDPNGLAVYNNELYVADQGNRRIRKITQIGNTKDFEVTTVVGSGNGWNGNENQAKATATFTWPTVITFDTKGNLYIADGGIDSLFRVGAGPTGTVQLVARGFGSWPTGMAADSADRIYVSTERGTMHRFEQAKLNYLGGNGVGLRNGRLADALFYKPTGMSIDARGNLYLAEWDNQTVRKIAFGSDVVGARILDSSKFRFLMKGAPAPTFTNSLPHTVTTQAQTARIVPIAPFDANIKFQGRKVSIQVSMATSIDGAYLFANEIGISEKRPLSGKVTGAKATFTFSYASKHTGKSVRFAIYGTNGDLRSPALTFPLQLGKAKTPVKKPAAPSSTAPSGITCKKGTLIRVFIASSCPTGFVKG
jgi:sugar lactone lactonase YvrE